MSAEFDELAEVVLPQASDVLARENGRRRLAPLETIPQPIESIRLERRVGTRRRHHPDEQTSAAVARDRDTQQSRLISRARDANHVLPRIQWNVERSRRVAHGAVIACHDRDLRSGDDIVRGVANDAAQSAAHRRGHDRRQGPRRRHECESQGAAALTDRHASKLRQVPDAPSGHVVPAGLELVEAKRAVGYDSAPQLQRRDVDVTLSIAAPAVSPTTPFRIPGPSGGGVAL